MYTLRPAPQRHLGRKHRASEGEPYKGKACVGRLSKGDGGRKVERLPKELMGTLDGSRKTQTRGCAT